MSVESEEKEEEEGSACMKETASPFSPVTRAIQEKEKSDRTLQQGESLPKLAQLLKTH